MMRLFSFSVLAVLTVALAVALGIGSPKLPKPGIDAAHRTANYERWASTVSWATNVVATASDRSVEVKRYLGNGFQETYIAELEGGKLAIAEDEVLCTIIYVPGPYSDDNIPKDAILRTFCVAQ